MVDQIDRIVIDNHDYRALADLDADVVLLEWDIAASKHDIEVFAGLARQSPGSVLVAPYLLYTPEPMWAHRSWEGEGPGATGAGPVDVGAQHCNLFGLGMCYLPKDLITGFIESGWSNHFGDVEFSMWHYHNVSKEVPIAWAIQPVHLNHPGVSCVD